VPNKKAVIADSDSEDARYSHAKRGSLLPRFSRVGTIVERFSGDRRILLMKTRAFALKITSCGPSVCRAFMPGVVLLVTTTCLMIFNFVQADDLSSEEQALVNKGAFMEMYKPDEHSCHFIAHITAVKNPKTGETRKTKAPDATVCFVFGMEDAEPAREQGRSMAEFHYSRSQAEQFLFAQGWDKYHDRFFTRCYVQEGEGAFDHKAAELLQKTAGEARQKSL
jgi:hypothetical protein